ncbi:FLYWCH-type zinc finger-containing protein 1 [Frankliniella fusca]|uniref:FLYWCH-type zinc finger-containing protein 1 n=1 Tax=Frankliniella fusca TaxID=407009 RepID=A0AAE1LTW0_9NEOP|nr:FLYWCH-type zinc finger-containing protein 1 [Frankliniella fusca]
MARAPHRAEFIKTKRGGLLLCHEGFQYHRTGRRADTIYWICSKRPECSARAITKGPPPDDARVSKAGDHIHAPNREETAACAVVNDMKDVATRHPEMPPANIIREGLADVDDEVLSQLPQRVSLKRAINRKRQAVPRNPIALGDISELPEEYQKTLGGIQYKVAVHQLLSLAFIPAEDVKDVFAELRAELPRQLRTLADYFKETYVGERPRRLRGNRQACPKPPRYAVED